jgi:chromosomal replication initiation ATPase DnaA
MKFEHLPITIRHKLESLCIGRTVTPRDVLGRSHDKETVSIRREFARKLRGTGLSYPQIGRYLDRHHTAVMHLCRGKRPEPRKPIEYPDLSGEWAI